jgi:hypothetical protein
MKALLIIMAVLFCSMAKGQMQYNYHTLPDSVKKDAMYIIWEDFEDFEVLDPGKGIEKQRLAVCVTNAHADYFNNFLVKYRKGEQVVKFDATIYDAFGKQLKKLKNNEIRDYSSVSDFSLYEDDRVKYAEFTHNQYPYTVVYEYEKKVEGLLHYPVKVFQRHRKAFVLNSVLQFTVPENISFRYKEFNLDNNVSVYSNKGKKTYIWKESKIKQEQIVDYYPHHQYYVKMVMLAPNDFSQGGYKGNLENWENMGLWIKELNKGRDQLSEATQQKVNDLVKDAKTDVEKVKLLYAYMQGKTRYVNISLGIGGYQPFPADFVDTKGYAECKGLSNYMFSLLRAAGIKSHYTLVPAEDFGDDILPDFPMNQFNHIILCVPLVKDTIWLECTNQNIPFNFLGYFTNDRHALLITEDGGKLVKTYRYPKELNTQYRNILVEIDAEGNATGNLKTTFNGLQYENRRAFIDKSVKDQIDALKEAYPVSGMEIKSVKFAENKEGNPSITEILDLNLPKFASISSKRMFLKLNQFSDAIFVPRNEERKIPFQLRSEFIDIDTVVFKVPAGYELESMPKTVDITNKFGSYSFTVIRDGNTFTTIRKYSSEKNTFDAKDYKEFYEYRKQISSVDKGRLVFVKKTE